MPALTSFARDRRATLRMAALGAAAFAAGAGQSRAQPGVRTIAVERLSVVSAKPFGAVVSSFESAIGRPDLKSFMDELERTQTYADMERVVARAVGKSGLMELARLNIGFVLGKEPGGQAHSLRFLIGNPLIMKDMAKYVPDAASYAPVTILIDQRADGVHLSYDRMVSLLSPYGHADALKVARDLDNKIETMLRTAAA